MVKHRLLSLTRRKKKRSKQYLSKSRRKIRGGGIANNANQARKDIIINLLTNQKGGSNDPRLLTVSRTEDPDSVLTLQRVKTEEEV
jgi:hypothetical protein